MLRTVNTAKLKQLKSNRRAIVQTTVFVVLVIVAMAFIAFAGHL